MHRDEQIAKLHWIEMGAGPVVVLVHGMAASLQDWQAWIPELAQHGLHLIAVDLPGHGRSPRPEDPRDYTLPAFFAAFETWLVGLGLEAPVMLIGHSLGGYFGIKLCLQHPELVRRLMLINPLFKAEQLNRAAQLLRRQPELWAGLLGLTPNWLIDRSVRWDPVFLKGVSGSARRRAADSLKMASPQILNLVHDIPDLTPRLSQVSTPTLLVWGADDRTLNPDYFPELAAWLPHVRERALAGCGHQPHLIQTERMIELALEFLLTAPFD